MRHSDFRLDDARKDDWERAQVRFGKVRFIFGFYFVGWMLPILVDTIVVAQIIHHHGFSRDWGHEVVLLVLGTILLFGCPFGFWNDSYYPRQDLDK